LNPAPRPVTVRAERRPAASGLAPVPEGEGKDPKVFSTRWKNLVPFAALLLVGMLGCGNSPKVPLKTTVVYYAMPG